MNKPIRILALALVLAAVPTTQTGCSVLRSSGIIATETTPRLEYEKAVTEFNATNAILQSLLRQDKLNPDQIMAAVAFQGLALDSLSDMRTDLDDAVVSPTFSTRLADFGRFLGQIESLFPPNTVDPRGLPTAEGGAP